MNYLRAISITFVIGTVAGTSVFGGVSDPTVKLSELKGRNITTSVDLVSLINNKIEKTSKPTLQNGQLSVTADVKSAQNFNRIQNKEEHANGGFSTVRAQRPEIFHSSTRKSTVAVNGNINTKSGAKTGSQLKTKLTSKSSEKLSTKARTNTTDKEGEIYKPVKKSGVLVTAKLDKEKSRTRSKPTLQKSVNIHSPSTPEANTPKQTVAEIPTKQRPAKTTRQEFKFSQLKAKLQGPEGLLHLRALKDFVAKWPEHTLARLWLVKGLVKTGDVEAAMTLIGEPGKWTEADWQVGFWKSNVLILAGEYELARSTIESTARTESKNTDLWVQQAVLEQESGNHLGAIQLLRIAVKLNPDHALAQLNLGYSLEHEALQSQALVAYQNFLISDNSALTHLRVPVMNRIGLLAKIVNSQKTTRIDSIAAGHIPGTAIETNKP